jgi:hypothetical protein
MRQAIYLFVLLSGCMLLPTQGIAQDKTSTPKPWPKEEQYWNIPKTPDQIYRPIDLFYAKKADPATDETPDMVPIVMLRPWVTMLHLMTAEECREISKDMMTDFYEVNKRTFRGAVRLWVDWEDGGIIGSEPEEGEYYFYRVICLPKDLVDDLDRIGTQYEAAASKKNWSELKEKKVASGRYLLIAENDERYEFRYDPKRFFERFQKYGVLPILMIPQTKDLEAWHDNDWNKDKKFRVLPLGEAKEIQ